MSILNSSATSLFVIFIKATEKLLLEKKGYRKVRYTELIGLVIGILNWDNLYMVLWE